MFYISYIMNEDEGNAKIVLLGGAAANGADPQASRAVDAASRRPKGSSGFYITETDVDETDVDEPRGLDYPALGNVRFAPIADLACGHLVELDSLSGCEGVLLTRSTFENEAQIILGNRIAFGDSDFDDLPRKRRSYGDFHFHCFDERKLVTFRNGIAHLDEYRNNGPADFRSNILPCHLKTIL
jgi:hypothetical protein